MPFTGGGAGAYSLQDHLHTNALFDGGSLEELVTLVDGATLASWIAAKFTANQKYVLLDSHLAVGVESTYTFTPATSIDLDLYEKIIVTFSGNITAALALRMKLNAIAAGYYDRGQRTTGVGVANIDNSAQAHWELASSTLNAGTANCIVVTELFGNSDNNVVDGFIKAASGWAMISEHKACNISNANPITSIQTFTSTSTWKAGTKIITMGVLP